MIGIAIDRFRREIKSGRMTEIGAAADVVDWLQTTLDSTGGRNTLETA
jgi:hypothetical protein